MQKKRHKKKPSEVDFCIKIDFEKKSDNPTRIFRTITELLDSFHQLDLDLVHSIDTKIEPTLLLEDIEVGSLKVWLTSTLSSIDDEGLKTLEWKKIVGEYLVRAKYLFINFLSDKQTINSRNQIKSLESDLNKLAKETDVKSLPIYRPIPQTSLVKNIKTLTSSLRHLKHSDKATYISLEGKEAEFNLTFKVDEDNFNKLLVREEIPSTNTMILKVKKPDYLGESMWDFKHGETPYQAKILDKPWLKKFQDREVEVKPGDALRVTIESIAQYGFENEVIDYKHSILKVHEVIPAKHPTQLDMYLEDGEK